MTSAEIIESILFVCILFECCGTILWSQDLPAYLKEIVSIDQENFFIM